MNFITVKYQNPEKHFQERSNPELDLVDPFKSMENHKIALKIKAKMRNKIK